jgi:hypothetical protein
MKKTLTPKQTKLDVNKNGKLDKDDFAMLRGKKSLSKAKGKKQAMPRKKGM